MKDEDDSNDDNLNENNNINDNNNNNLNNNNLNNNNLNDNNNINNNNNLNDDNNNLINNNNINNDIQNNDENENNQIQNNVNINNNNKKEIKNNNIDDDIQILEDEDFIKNENQLKELKEKKKILNDKILNKTIKNSIIYKNNPTIFNSSYYSSFKSSIKNTKNKLKFNMFKMGTELHFKEAKIVNIFSNKYDYRKENENILNELQKLIYFSYRYNLPRMENYVNKNHYYSDSGWGCMIRASQMCFYNILYNLLIENNNNNNSNNNNNDNNNKNYKYELINLFVDLPINVDKLPKIMEFYYNSILNRKSISISNKNLIESIFPPFSIFVLIGLGEIFQKKAGDWFSDYNLINLYKFINNKLNVIPNLKIFSFIGDVIIEKIIKKCFEKIEEENNNLLENNYYEFKGEKYKFKKACVIFVSIRLGLHSMPEEYFEPIKFTFDCKQCFGFIGGKNKEASFFIGYYSDYIIYLDPHFCQGCNYSVPIRNRADAKPFHDNKKFYQLEFKKLQAAITIGFLIKNLNDFKEFINYVDNMKKKFKKNSLFIVQDEKIKVEKNIIKDIYDDKDDF